MFCAKNEMWGKWGKGVEKFPNIVWNILGNRECGMFYSMLYFFILL